MKKYRIIRRELEERPVFLIEKKFVFLWIKVRTKECYSANIFSSPVSFWRIEEAEDFIQRIQQPRIVKEIAID
jgi:hypothetical protein